MIVKKIFYSVGLFWLSGLLSISTHAESPNLWRMPERNNIKQEQANNFKEIDLFEKNEKKFWIKTFAIVTTTLVGSIFFLWGYWHFTKESLPRDQCLAIRYRGKKIWINKDFAWFDSYKIDSKKMARDFDDKCIVCCKEFKILKDPIFLLCPTGCAKPSCVSCWNEWSKSKYSWYKKSPFSTTCSYCRQPAPKLHINFLRDNSYHLFPIVLHLQKKIQDTKLSLSSLFYRGSKIDIIDRADSIEKLIKKRNQS